MQNKQSLPADASSKGQTVFEYVLLIIIAAVLACKTTITQAPSIISGFNDIFYNLAVSLVLLCMAAAWFFYNVSKKEFRYRFSGLEIGTCIFTIGAVVACFFASNKRTAISDMVAMVLPMLMAIILVQLLTSAVRIKLLLYVIVALGALNVAECVDQLSSSNEMLIQQYKTDPNGTLARVNVEPGSYQHMLFEHRLYSKDVRGFFTTSNSAGSFFILALAAALALVYEKRQLLKIKCGTSGELAARILVAGVIIAGIAITHSKGAIGAIIIVAGLGAWAYRYRQWLREHILLEFLSFAAICICAVLAVVSYGLAHGTLPGGNSLMVRWQYWVGAAKVIAAHPLTGVGAGNFGTYYQLYKIPAALETVKDPHNFILSILAQFGPLGLLGFFSALAVPFVFACKYYASHCAINETPAFKRNITIIAAVVGATMLAVRPLIMTTERADNFLVTAFVIGWLYVLPVIILTATFVLLSMNEPKTCATGKGNIILVAGVAAVLIHNLVDFAIFEPGIQLVFWTVVAIVIAQNFNNKATPPRTIKPTSLTGSMAVMVGFAILLAYLHFEFRPVLWSSLEAQSGLSIARRAIEYVKTHPDTPDENKNALIQTSFDYAYKRLYQAATYDELSSVAPYQGALLALEVNEVGGQKNIKYLQWAQNQLLVAIERDRADFKSYEKLAEVLQALAADMPKDRQGPLLHQAQNAYIGAIERYPGSERLRFEAGILAEKLGQTDEAAKQFKEAVVIEDSYRKQFEKMYPGRPPFSRLGQRNYEYAKERIESFGKFEH